MTYSAVLEPMAMFFTNACHDMPDAISSVALSVCGIRRFSIEILQYFNDLGFRLQYAVAQACA